MTTAQIQRRRRKKPGPKRPGGGVRYRTALIDTARAASAQSLRLAVLGWLTGKQTGSILRLMKRMDATTRTYAKAAPGPSYRSQQTGGLV
jgi:hypothetical protein